MSNDLQEVLKQIKAIMEDDNNGSKEIYICCHRLINLQKFLLTLEGYDGV